MRYSIVRLRTSGRLPLRCWSVPPPGPTCDLTTAKSQFLYVMLRPPPIIMLEGQGCLEARLFYFTPVSCFILAYSSIFDNRSMLRMSQSFNKLLVEYDKAAQIGRLRVGSKSHLAKVSSLMLPIITASANLSNKSSLAEHRIKPRSSHATCPRPGNRALLYFLTPTV